MKNRYPREKDTLMPKTKLPAGAKKLFSAKQIKKRVREIARQLAEQFWDKDPIIIICLNGALPFGKDLIDALDIQGMPLEYDCVRLLSYHGKISSGEITVIQDLTTNLAGRHVIIVEDIADTGRTANFLVNMTKGRNPASVTFVALLDKPKNRKEEFQPDIIGFTLEGTEFVIGYGLDWNNKWRGLRAIYIILEPK